MNTLGEQHHQIRGQGKDEQIDQKGGGEGDLALNDGKQGKCAGEMAADIEHIKGIYTQIYGVEYDFVQSNGDAKCDGKHGNGAQQGFDLCLYVSRTVQINADGQHGTVAKHGLNIDAHRVGKYVTGVKHNARAGEDGVGGQKRHQAPMDLAFAEDARQHSDVHGGRAELPREDVPLKIEYEMVVHHVKIKAKQLIDLKQNDEDAGHKYGAANAGVVSFFMGDTKQNACYERKRKK